MLQALINRLREMTDVPPKIGKDPISVFPSYDLEMRPDELIEVHCSLSDAPFDILIQCHHRIAGMYAVTRPMCLPKSDGWPDGIECRFWRSGIERRGSYAAVHDALRVTGEVTLQPSDWKLSHGLE